MTTSDEEFGQAVASHRATQRMSQKDLAAALTQAGMKVDAPAVSRIEKGQRAVRLAEALKIADVLGREIGDLVGAKMTAQERMGAAFNNVEWRGNQLAESSARFAEELMNAGVLFGEDPSLLDALDDLAVGRPRDSSDFPRWYAGVVRERVWQVRRERVGQGSYTVYPVAADKPGLLEAITAVADTALLSGGEYEALEESGVMVMGVLDTVADEVKHRPTF
ncbi:helix-turn-helix transcriptional regulator [Microbacterium sp. TPD7012]|uniref:helix-turn-helix domain-containing protein n=1 Tax=Microbacterium sp. TPD7012 TaxID=2171975 RepID=UPI001402462A|nr:helix-turn-helix transcriptional regulator [Microbacterium sp. TPD7012]